jgi:hypothetical protein
MYGDSIQDVTSVRAKPSGRWKRLTANPAGAIYGTILVTAVIAAAAAHGESALTIEITAVVTVLIFWLAHVYSEVIAHRLKHNRLDWSAIPKIMVDELPMLEGPAPALVLLLLGALGVFRERLAIDLALAAGVVQLVLWGVDVARQAGWSWPKAVAAGIVNGGFGAIIILLKALLH